MLLRTLVLMAPLWLTACSSLTAVSIPLAGNGAPGGATAFAAGHHNDAPAPVDSNDDLVLGKRHFAATNYGLAEKHFRRAVEASSGPRSRDAEAWIGLAASYDRLRRFDLADRAYDQALRAVGPTPEILNNQGYSFLLRRDYKNARVKLTQARQKDPENIYIANNWALLEESEGPR